MYQQLAKSVEILGKASWLYSEDIKSYQAENHNLASG